MAYSERLWIPAFAGMTNERSRGSPEPLLHAELPFANFASFADHLLFPNPEVPASDRAFWELHEVLTAQRRLPCHLDRLRAASISGGQVTPSAAAGIIASPLLRFEIRHV
jgi:hypothetical protein